jgi:tetratricopeptide (TPR) repeat protein
MRATLQLSAAALTLAAALALGQMLPRVFGDRLPQTAGTSLLDQVLGEARMMVSDAMILKADEYFHGGVRVADCTHADAHAASSLDLPGSAPAHAHEDEDDAQPGAPPRDPWSWVNTRIHVAEHRHMDGDQARELIPWYWAAVRLEPKNVQAYLLCASVMSQDLLRPAEALRILEEGIRNNPADAELEIDAGCIHLNRLRNPSAAQACFDRAYAKWAQDRDAHGHADGDLKMRILFYLCHLARQRNDTAALNRYFAEAQALGIRGGSFSAIENMAKP